MVRGLRSRARENVAHGGAKWNKIWAPPDTQVLHTDQSLRTAASLLKSVPPASRSWGGATGMPNLSTAALSLPCPAKNSTNSKDDLEVVVEVVPATCGGAFALGRGRPPPAPTHAPHQALDEWALPPRPPAPLPPFFFFAGFSSTAEPAVPDPVTLGQSEPRSAF